jgi:hypothetical protein
MDAPERAANERMFGAGPDPPFNALYRLDLRRQNPAALGTI